MNDLALQRLTAAGWTPERKADYASIEKDYEIAGMEIPDKLKPVFSSFGLLEIEFDDQPIQQNKPKSLLRRLGNWLFDVEDHRLPCIAFDPNICFDDEICENGKWENYHRKLDDFDNLFEEFGLPGLVYPVGYVYNIEKYGDAMVCMHENGCFYLYVFEEYPVRIGDSVDSLINGLIGDDRHNWGE